MTTNKDRLYDVITANCESATNQECGCYYKAKTRHISLMDHLKM